MPTLQKTKHTNHKPTDYEARARIVKALAHPSRLLIVDLLKEQDRCVCEITEAVGADISTVSRHLATLRNAGIVSDRKHGNQVFYHLRTPCVLGFVSCVEQVLDSLHDDPLCCQR